MEEFIPGTSQCMKEIIEKVQSVSRTEIPVLLIGETGVGKEHLARMIHHQNPHSRKPFLPLNCSAVPSFLLESELFGYEISDIYCKLEEIANQNKHKLNVMLLTPWGSIDIENFIKERNHRISVRVADCIISQMIQEWEYETGINNFNMIVIKSKDSVDIFPLLDNSDLRRWEDYKLKLNFGIIN